MSSRPSLLRRRRVLRAVFSLVLLAFALVLFGCNKNGKDDGEYAYVAAPQTFIRDRVAAVFNKVATVHNGDRVRVLEHKRNWVRVRSAAGDEGWIQERYLAGQDVYDQLQQLARDHARDPVQSTAVTRASLNMHVTPSRVSPALYQLKEAEKVQVLSRAVAEKEGPGAAPAPKKDKDEDAEATAEKKTEEETEAAKARPEPASASAKPADAEEKPAILEDWWLVRDASGRYGWVLGRMIDIDIPVEVAQYAEGQRIVAAFVLDRVKDDSTGDLKPEYLVLLSEPKDGLDFDFNQYRVFTWNRKKSRYETAGHERMAGVLPAEVAIEDFGKDGKLPVFTVRARDIDGNVVARKYKLQIQVRRIVAPGEQPQKLAQPSHGPAGKKTVAHKRSTK